MTRQLYLKPGRERSIRNRHPWVFSGGIARAGGEADSPIAEIFAATGERVGSGFFSPHSQIVARVWAFGNEPIPDTLLQQRISSAIARRRHLFREDNTIVRLAHAEGDDVSGLIIDRYGEIAVVEITSWGLDQKRDLIIETIKRETGVRLVYLKNDVPARKLEQLPLEDAIHGEGETRVEVVENGLRFVVDPREGQKTGFFIDQRDNRQLVREYAKDRRLLNLFSYSGGFGVYAIAGGASRVEEVDISHPAIELARENHRINGSENVDFMVADVFDYARALAKEARRFDLVVCDPPAFARSRNDVEKAARGYKDVNLQSLKLVAPGGYLFTFSCSGHMSLDLFQKIVYSAALDARRSVSFVRRLGAGEDHPV